MKKEYKILGLALIATTTLGFNAQASSVPRAPAADAGRFDQTVRERTAEAPRTDISAMPSGGAIAQAPPGAEKIRFTLDNLELEGVTAYNEAELREVYGASLGQNISLADLYEIAARLTTKYRNDGYILTQIVVPPQTIEKGTARLQVVEGRIDRITVEGPAAEQSALPLIRSYTRTIPSGTTVRPLNNKDLERALLLINDLPGLSARSIISPSATVTGAADLTILVERKSYDATVGIDNYGSRYLGRWQGNASASANSFFGLNERISGQVVYAPHRALNDRELAYFAGTYAQPIGPYGTSVALNYSYTNTEPGLNLRDFDVFGQSQYWAATVAHPIIRSRNMNLSSRVTFDARNAKNKNNIPDPRKDEIRALRVGGRFDALDNIFSGGVSTVDVQVARGVSWLGASSKGDAQLTRERGDPEFTKFEAEAQRLQRLAPGWNILLGITGQLSDSPQLASEEFGVGGISYGRGYDPSEIVGDSGYAGKVELQWNPEWSLPNLVNAPQVFTFWDGGKAYNRDSTTGSDVESLTSAGLGFRADIGPALQTEFFVAKPLTRDVQTEGDTDPRFYVSVSRKF